MWWNNVSTIAKSVDKIIEEQPVAVFISGDFIYYANCDPNPILNNNVPIRINCAPEIPFFTLKLEQS